MAINRGVLGTQVGSMGGITASTWKGKNVYKQKVPATNSSNTPAQALQRLKFATLALYARIFGPVIRVGFRTAAVSMTEQNVFTKRNLQFVDIVDGYAILDMEKVELSAGTVEPLVGLTLVLNGAGNQATVTWQNNSNGTTALPTDKVYITVTTDRGDAGGVSMGTVLRSAGSAIIPVPVDFNAGAAKDIAYAFAKRANSTEASPTARALNDI